MLFSFFSLFFSFTLDLLIHAKHLFLISVLELFSLSFFVLVLFYPETSFFLFSRLVPHYDYYQTYAFACLYEFVRSLPFYFWRKSQQSKAGCFLYFLYIRKRENKAKEEKRKKKKSASKSPLYICFPPQNGHARTLFRVFSTPHDFENLSNHHYFSSFKATTSHQFHCPLFLCGRNSTNRFLCHGIDILRRIKPAILEDLCGGGTDDGADGICCCVEVESVQVAWDVAEKDFCWGLFCELFLRRGVLVVGFLVYSL